MTNDNRPPPTVYLNPELKLKVNALPRPRTPKRVIDLTRELDDEQILKLNHVEWIDGAVHTLSQETGVQKTPFLLGMITRLGWLSRYVSLLEAEVAALRAEVTKKELPDDH